MAKPVVIVVGADKGGVGKTTVSRTLLDYFSANNIPTRAFDTESPRGTLKRFHPNLTEIVDMTTTSDQMKIFDTLTSAGPSVTVIDVRAGLLSPALASLRDIGFLDAAKSGQITFAVFHILGPSIASLDEIAETANFMQGAKYFLVKNFINNTSFFEWDQSTYNSYFHRIKDATELTIPKLNEMAYEQVEVASVPFLKFVANKGTNDEAANYSFVLRGYVRHWLANVLSEFLLLKNGEVAAFDINLKEPSLLEYLPVITETAEVDNTFGKMALMDRLIVNDGIAKVIDLGFHAFDEFFKMSEEIGFMKEAARRGVAPVILFVADTDRASARGYAMLQQQIPPKALVTVDNEFVVRGELPATMADVRILRIAALPVFLKTYIDRLTFSFTDYLRHEKDSSTELHQWIRNNYLNFRELELNLILQKS